MNVPNLLDGHGECNAYCRGDVHAVVFYSDGTLDDTRRTWIPPVGYHSPPATPVRVELAREMPPPTGHAAHVFADKGIDLGDVRAFILWFRVDAS